MPSERKLGPLATKLQQQAIGSSMSSYPMTRFLFTSCSWFKRSFCDHYRRSIAEASQKLRRNYDSGKVSGIRELNQQL